MKKEGKDRMKKYTCDVFPLLTTACNGFVKKHWQECNPCSKIYNKNNSPNMLHVHEKGCKVFLEGPSQN